MDISRLQVAVYEKTGIRLDRTDPVFALIAVNEAVISELLSTAQEQWAQNNSELDVKIGSLVKVHEHILAASKDLTTRANQAHMTAALKAAAEAKTEIFNAARDAVSVEVGKAASIVTENAAQLAAASKRARTGSWSIAIVQAIIGGMVAAITVLAFMSVR
jgi:hypothetical protein